MMAFENSQHLKRTKRSTKSRTNFFEPQEQGIPLNEES